MVHLSLALLGSFEARLDDRPITTFESGRVRALLVVLAVEADRPHLREALAELLWPGWDEGSAQANLRHALSSLRHTLGDAASDRPFLLVTRDTLAFNPHSDHETDAVTLSVLARHRNDIAALEQAAALYRGPFCAGALLTDSAAYEAWSREWREHFARLIRETLERLGEHYLAQGDTAQAEGHLRRLLALEPLAEAAHRQLMRLLAASGKRNEALTHYARCRQVLAEELGVEPDPETTRLYEQLRAGAPPSAAPRATVHAAAVAAPDLPPAPPRTDIAATILPRLRQLPPAPADFYGREAELRALHQALDQEGVRLCAIRGLGGMGKTTLALRLAEQLAARYPAAQLYLDLRGTERHPVNPAEAMAHVIRSFYPHAELPQEEDDLRALYCSQLREQQALLLLDNARDRAQVEPLLPPAPCLLLLTSRARFALPGAYTLDLTPPASQEATAWLRTIAPRLTPDQAAAIAQACGQLPLALRVAGSALAEWEDLAPEEYLAAVRAHPADLAACLAEVESSLARSDALLPERLRQHWRTLGVFPSTFTRAAAEAVWGLEAAPTPPGPGDLSELVRTSLVEYDSLQRRYRLHDLCRAYALEHLDAEARRAAQWRYTIYYGQVLAEARALFFQFGDKAAQGMALYDQEAVNIEGAFASLAAEVERDDEAARLVLHYVNPFPYHSEAGTFRLLPRQRLPWEEAALRAARRLGNRHREGECLLSLAQAYLDTGSEFALFAQVAQEALSLAQALGDPLLESIARHCLGMAIVHLGEPRRGLGVLERGVAIAREHGFPIPEGNCLCLMAEACLMMGQAQQALEHSRQALAVLSTLANPRLKGYALWQVGRSLVAMGEARQAIPYLEEGEAIFRQAGPPHDLALAFNFLGEGYGAAGDFSRAIACHEEALALCRQIGRRDEECNALMRLGQVHAAQHDFQRAVTYYEQALAMATGKLLPREGLVLWHLSLALHELGERVRAIMCAERALEIAVQIGSTVTDDLRQQLEAWGREVTREDS